MKRNWTLEPNWQERAKLPSPGLEKLPTHSFIKMRLQLNAASKGYVHVFDRIDFVLRGGSEWMCQTTIRPKAIVEVTFADMRQTIQVIAPLG